MSSPIRPAGGWGFFVRWAIPRQARGAISLALTPTLSRVWERGERSPLRQLPQDGGQDAAVAVVVHFDGGVDAADDGEAGLDAGVGLGDDGQLLAGLEGVGEADDLEGLLAGQA